MHVVPGALLQGSALLWFWFSTITIIAREREREREISLQEEVADILGQELEHRPGCISLNAFIEWASWQVQFGNVSP